MKRLLMAGLLAVSSVSGGEIRVRPDEAEKAVLKRVRPVYNAVARQMRVEGQVVVDVHIDEKGSVQSVEVISGNSLLTAPVVAALKEWKFTPFAQDGRASAAVTTLRFQFRL